MKTQISIEQLLRWRLARAEAEAPPPPRAARLLELVRPWWETWPERFRAVVEHLGKIEVAYGHAMADARQARAGQLVPALILRTEAEIETSAQVLYLSVRDGQLRLRFELATAGLDTLEPSCEVTFVSAQTAEPLFSARAECSVGREYGLAAELSEELAAAWERLKVTDAMPFKLILRPLPGGG